MIRYQIEPERSILDSGADAIVIPVNCQGVMGKGLALTCKERYPAASELYMAMARQGGIKPGIVFPVLAGIDRYIFFFPTKREWRNASRLLDIQDGMRHLTQLITGLRIRYIAIPALGCGLGGLKWKDVEEGIRFALDPLPQDLTVYLYPPRGE